jgi:uncharacterized protein (TIGR03382 family)
MIALLERPDRTAAREHGSGGLDGEASVARERNWEMQKVLIAAGAASAIACTASADVVFSLTNFRVEGSELTAFTGEGDLTGMLTGATINIVMTAWTNYTYADDLCIYLSTASDFSEAGAVRLGGLGGFGSVDAVTNYGLPMQERRRARSIEFTTPIDASNGKLRLWIGNGFGGATTTGTWNGTIVLHGLSGLNGVPTPGSIALLGLSAAVLRRRRR